MAGDGTSAGVDRDDAIALDDDDGRRPDLPRFDVDPAVGTQNGDVGHGRGSTKQVKYADPLSGTRGWSHTSTGNDTLMNE